MEPTYTAMVLGVTDENGNICNEKFFVSRLPEIGEAVELVFVGFDGSGFLRFQYRVKEK